MEAVSALREALLGTSRPYPQSYGGMLAQSRNVGELARIIEEIPLSKQPRAMSPDQLRRYRSARRTIERHTTAKGKQTRTRIRDRKRFEQQRRRLRAHQLRGARRMITRGADAVIEALVRISDDVDLRTMPAGGSVHIPPGSRRSGGRSVPGMVKIIGAMLAGRDDRATSMFLDAFFHYYGLEEAEVIDVVSIELEAGA